MAVALRLAVLAGALVTVSNAQRAPITSVVWASFPGTGCMGSTIVGVEGVRSFSTSSGIKTMQSPLNTCCVYGTNPNVAYWTCSSKSTQSPPNVNFQFLACTADVATVRWNNGSFDKNQQSCNSNPTLTPVVLNTSGFAQCVPAIGEYNTSMIVTSIGCPGAPPIDAPPGKGYVAVIESPAGKQNRFLEMNLPFGKCVSIGTGHIQLESCTATTMQFSFCPNSTNCSCGMAAIRNEFSYSTHTVGSTIGVALPSSTSNPFGPGGSATVLALRCPADAPAPLPNPAVTLATWNSQTEGLCDPQQPPSWVARLTAQFNRCESIPTHSNSILNGLYYMITGCTPGTTANPPQIQMLVCGDGSCKQCKPITYSAGACQANPFVPYTPSVATSIQCPNGPGQAVPATRVSATVVTYGVDEDECSFSATPTQFVPMQAPIGTCTPFPPGPPNSTLNNSYYLFTNCTDDLVAGSLCSTPTCSGECEDFLLTFDPSDPCVENPLVPPGINAFAGNNSNSSNQTSAMVLSLRCPQTGPPTPAASSKGFICVSGSHGAAGHCVGTNVTGGGTSLKECENMCLDAHSKYICVGGACVVSVDPARGVSKSTCLELCIK